MIDLPPDLAFVAENWVIGVSGVLFCLEFIADKIPFFDLIWNALQTFVRIPVAAFLAYDATSTLSPGGRLVAAAAGAAIAMAAHGTKVAARAIVTPSPEPFSNIALSFGEDIIAVTLTWFATQHPIIAASIVLVCVVALFLLARTIVRLIRRVIEQRRRAVVSNP